MAAKWAAAGFLCLMVLFVTIQIVARYVLSDAPAWTEEAARYAMTWSALLAATCAFHDRVDPVLVTVSASSPGGCKRSRDWRDLSASLFSQGPCSTILSAWWRVPL